MDSTSQRTVWNPSSSTLCSISVELRTLLMEQIQLSHAPWCDPIGGLKVHFIPFCASVLLIYSRFHPCIACFNSWSAPTKFVLLSEQSSWTCPLLAMKCRKALMKELVSKDDATSMCTALNRWRSFHKTPSSLDVRKSEIINTNVTERRSIQWNSVSGQVCHLLLTGGTKQPVTNDTSGQDFSYGNTGRRNPIACWCCFDSTWFLPQWPTVLWMWRIMRSGIWRSFANITGCFDSSGMAAWLSLNYYCQDTVNQYWVEPVYGTSCFNTLSSLETRNLFRIPL